MIGYKNYTDASDPNDLGGTTGIVNAQGYLILNPDMTVVVGLNLANTDRLAKLEVIKAAPSGNLRMTG